MQETHSVEAVISRWKNEWGALAWFAHGTSNSRGVAILIKNKLAINVHNVIKDVNGRFILLYATIQGAKLLIANLYAPNMDVPEYFQTTFS